MQLSSRKKSRQKLQFPIDKFNGGSNLLVDDARVGINQAVQATNLMQSQDGVWTTRYGRDYYGTDLTTNIDGAAEYVTSAGTTELIVVTDGVVKKSTNGGAWTTVTGATFTAGIQCYFMQIAGYLYIFNGTDSLARYDGTVLTTYTSLSAPTGLSASITASGIASGTYKYYGIVTALNDVGETVGSACAILNVNTLRESWNSDTANARWTWNAVSGAERYQFYLSDEDGDESYVMSTENTQFDDNGTLPINPYVKVPLDNTTAAPKFKSAVVSGNRIWATNDTTEKFIVRWSGTGLSMGKFSEFYGGGWINLEKGGREMPSVVVHYQSGGGEGRATVLSRTPEGKGAVWQIALTSFTVGDTTFSVPSAQKVIGSYGTSSILGVVSTTTDIGFPNKSGFFFLGPQQNYYGILRTREASSIIRPYWRSLIGSQLDKICSFFYDAKIFISVPTTTTGNSRTIIMDTERGNWTVDWSFGTKQFLEYTDTLGVSHLLYVPVSGTRLVELSENIQGDFGAAFETSYLSGRISVDKLWNKFARIKRVFIKLGRPRGSINFEVAGTERTKPFTAVATKTITPAYSLSGHGYDLMGTFLEGTSDVTPSLYSDSADIRYVSIRKKIRDFQLRVTSNSTNSKYTILGFIVEGFATATRPPRAWKV